MMATVALAASHVVVVELAAPPDGSPVVPHELRGCGEEVGRLEAPGAAVVLELGGGRGEACVLEVVAHTVTGHEVVLPPLEIGRRTKRLEVVPYVPTPCEVALLDVQARTLAIRDRLGVRREGDVASFFVLALSEVPQVVACDLRFSEFEPSMRAVGIDVTHALSRLLVQHHLRRAGADTLFDDPPGAVDPAPLRDAAPPTRCGAILAEAAALYRVRSAGVEPDDAGFAFREAVAEVEGGLACAFTLEDLRPTLAELGVDLERGFVQVAIEALVSGRFRPGEAR